jgi:ferric-dicitrate binding protein FerR (iron transport regulator)
MNSEFDYKQAIQKFLAGEISEDEISELEEWLKTDKENRKIFDEENELWRKLDVRTNMYHFDTDIAWSEINRKIGLDKKAFRKVMISSNVVTTLIAAASFAIVAAIGVLYLWLNEKQSVKAHLLSTTIIKTDKGEKAQIFLSDSTSVILNSESVLEYDLNYNNKDRKVKLTGEAYFNVRTNAEKPFEVHSENMKIVATGTRFNVYSYKNEERTETTLEEGNISVFIDRNKPFDLKKGQQVVLFTRNRKFIVRDVSTETYTSWKENKLRFIDTSLEEALRKIARKYNVVFEIRNKELLDLKYTGTFIDESIDDVMQGLKEISPITYKIYNRTTINDKKYLKPKIVISKKP